MLLELEHLIRLQQLEDRATGAREQINNIPVRLEKLELQIAERLKEVEDINQTLEEHRTSRVILEKEVSEIQSRLSRSKEQLMAVKTNKEYQAMQKEISNGEEELKRLEDKLLEQMLEGDDLNGSLKHADQLLIKERNIVETERARIEKERTELEQQIKVLQVDRNGTVSQLPSQTVALFKMLARGRKGIAVVEAANGRCNSCQVRLRPQLFNNVRSNNTLIQCESCQRILYFAEPRHVTG